MNQTHFVTPWTEVLSRQNLKAFVHILLPCVFEKLILNFVSIPCFKKKSLQGHSKYENINYSVTLPWIPWRSTVIPTQSHYMITLQFTHSVLSDSATPWTAARQASLSVTNSRSLLKLTNLVKWSLPEGSVGVQSDLKEKKKEPAV